MRLSLFKKELEQYVTVKDYDISKSIFRDKNIGNCTIYLSSGEIVTLCVDGDTFKEVELKLQNFIYKYEQYAV